MSIRTIICTVAGLLAVWGLFLAAPVHSYSPAGIVLPAQTVRAPISADTVHIYHQSPGADFQKLGLIRVEFHSDQIDENAKEVLFAKVKKLAASVGANGVMINLFEPNVTEVGPILTFWGTAVYVPNQTGSAH